MSKKTLHRKLSARHIAMIAIGGSIGSGIFVASGTAIHTAGPGGAILAYSIIGLMVYFLMTSLGEMATLIPTTGSFCDYAGRFVDPAFGFAMSYNYWLNWAVTTAVDLSAAALIMHTWVPEYSFSFWAVLFFIVILALNLVSVNLYGELQYWFSGIKVVAVILFILIGIALIFGAWGRPVLDWSNWTLNDAPFHAGWAGFVSVLMIAGFSFQGTEIFGMTAGETKDPNLSIPKAVRNVFWRILLFYVLSMVVIGFLIPYTNPLLITSSTTNIGASPFTLVFKMAGLRFAETGMTLIVLLAILSAANSSMYTASRTLWHLAQERYAPHFFANVTHKYGVPIPALLLSAVISAAVFLSSSIGEGKVFVWLLNTSALTGFIAWFGIALCHYRFRRAYLIQGHSLSKLPFYAKGFPFGPLFAIVLTCLIVAGQQFDSFLSHTVNIDNLIGTYIGLPFFLISYAGYKIRHRTKLIPLEKCRFDYQIHK
jgi:lysine-specific permease